MVLTSYRHGFHHGAVSAWSCWLSAEKKVSTQDKHLQESRSRKETNCLIGNDWHTVSFANPFFSGSSPRSFCPSLYEPPVSFRTKLTSPTFYNLVLMHSHLDPDMCPSQQFLQHFLAELAVHHCIPESLILWNKSTGHRALRSIKGSLLSRFEFKGPC